jgi:hypothetical protein
MSNRKRRRYTDEERANLVVMLEAEGYPEKKGALARVSKYAGVPKSTIRGWYILEHNPPPAQLRTEKKGDLAELFEDVAYKMLGHANQDTTIVEMSGKDAVIAAATATDKMRLLRGLPTEIIEIIPTIQDIYKALEDKGLEPSVVFDRMKQRLYDDSTTLQ